jgi:hypothetical protein
MLPEDLKADVLEIASIAKACPDNLQERCFELLLSHYLDGLGATAPKNEERAPQERAPEHDQGSADSATNGQASVSSSSSGQDLTASDLHLKARKFLEKYGRSVADLNQLFYKEGEEFKPLYEDLKTTKITESQIRLALLAALKEGIKTGDFVFDGEKVRAECQVRKCYDQANFAATFKRNATLFDAFDSYDSESPKVRLSEAGKEQLSGLIVDLG